MKKVLPPLAYWTDFEDLIEKLFKCKYKNDTVQKNGRSGQPQAGVDVFVRNSLIGVQCKKQDDLAGTNLTKKEIYEEVSKAKTFSSQLKEYIICYTGLRDNNLQQIATKISSDHKASSLFEVTLMSWEDINDEIQQHPNLLLDYLSDLIHKVDEIRASISSADAIKNLILTLQSLKTDCNKSINTMTLTIYARRLEFLLRSEPPHLLRDVNQVFGAIESYEKYISNLQSDMIMGRERQPQLQPFHEIDKLIEKLSNLIPKT